MPTKAHLQRQAFFSPRKNNILYTMDGKDSILYKGQRLFRLYVKDLNNQTITKGGYVWSVTACEDFSMVKENAKLCGTARIGGTSSLDDNTIVEGDVRLHNVVLTGNSNCFGYGVLSTLIRHNAYIPVANNLQLWQVLSKAVECPQVALVDDSIPQCLDV